MNIIKKYWNSVYIYVLLLVPGFCICAGIFWTICKHMGLYSQLSWTKILLFDATQLMYLGVALFFIYQNRKDASYIAEHLSYVKGFIVFSLFVQYNFILYLFASYHVWECTFLFLAIIVFLFDSKLMLFNTILYGVSLLVAHWIKPKTFVDFQQSNIVEVIAYRIVIYVLTSLCIVLIVYFVERFLMQAGESDEENLRLMEKQLAYYQDMELLDTEIRKFRHDIKNHFFCMETLFHNGNIEELQEYFMDLHQSFPAQEKIYCSGNEIVDAILHHDLSHYCREEVSVTIYGTLPSEGKVSAMDLCTIFSNILSNAIASANQCVGVLNPQIDIHFSSGKKYFSIAMSNSICQNKKNHKDKDRNHGFGINKVKGVLEKYDGKMEIAIEKEMYNITLYLPV